MSEIQSGPTVKQPWEYQLGWARQKLLPSELGSFMKGLLGGLHLSLDPQARPDRVRANQKELQRRAARTQEAQNKFRFWAKSEIGTKDSNFINILQHLHRKQQMQTENNKTFNTLYNKFLLIEKNKANTIKHPSTGKQYLRENDNNEIQDEDPGFGGNTTSTIINSAMTALGLLMALRGRRITSKALNTKHKKLTDEIRKINSDRSAALQRPGANTKDTVKAAKDLKAAAAQRISSAADDKIIGASKWLDPTVRWGVLGGLGTAHAGYGIIRDLKDRAEGHGSLSNGEIVGNALSRLAAPFVWYGAGRALPSVLKYTPRNAARKWSTKHRQNVKKFSSRQVRRDPSLEASKLLTTPVQNTLPKYKGAGFGRIYDNNPLFGADAFSKQLTWKGWKQALENRERRFWGKSADLFKIIGPKNLKSALTTGRGAATAAALYGLGAVAKDELIDALAGRAPQRVLPMIPFVGPAIADVIPDIKVRGSLFDSLYSKDMVEGKRTNPGGLHKGYRAFNTQYKSTDPTEEYARRQLIGAYTRSDGSVSNLPTQPKDKQRNPRYLVQNSNRSLLNRIWDSIGGNARERTITINTGQDQSDISTRSRPMTPAEQKKIEALLSSQR